VLNGRSVQRRPVLRLEFSRAKFRSDPNAWPVARFIKKD
jgi:hypothetical protein